MNSLLQDWYSIYLAALQYVYGRFGQNRDRIIYLTSGKLA